MGLGYCLTESRHPRFFNKTSAPACCKICTANFGTASSRGHDRTLGTLALHTPHTVKVARGLFCTHSAICGVRDCSHDTDCAVHSSRVGACRSSPTPEKSHSHSTNVHVVLGLLPRSTKPLFFIYFWFSLCINAWWLEASADRGYLGNWTPSFRLGFPTNRISKK